VSIPDPLPGAPPDDALPDELVHVDVEAWLALVLTLLLVCAEPQPPTLRSVLAATRGSLLRLALEELEAIQRRLRR
jgi:hypothetical protein